MVKSAITHRCQYWSLNASIFEALSNTDARTHRNLCPASILRCIHTDNRATNIPRSNDFIFSEARQLDGTVECVIGQAVRATRTELQRTWWCSGSRLYLLRTLTISNRGTQRILPVLMPISGSHCQMCNCLLHQFHRIVTHSWQQFVAFAQNLNLKTSLSYQGEYLCL